MDPNQPTQPVQQPQPQLQTNQPVVETPQPTPVVNQPMAKMPQTPKGTNKMVPLLIILIVILVATAATYVFLNQSQTQKAPPVGQIEPTIPIASSPTVTPTDAQEVESLDTGDPALDLQDIQTDLNQL